MVAKNDITGDMIKTKSNGHQKYSDGWDRIFGNQVKVRKKTPSHATTQIHIDKTKQIPRHYKYNNIEEQL